MRSRVTTSPVKPTARGPSFRPVAAALACCALTALSSHGARAAAFDTCPAEGFLIQGATARTYAVDLTTGDYSLETTDHGLPGVLNAVGFNPNDGYLYAWSRELGQPVRIHSDWHAEPLAPRRPVTSSESDDASDGGHFFVGDVSATLNRYFVFRRGNAENAGVHSIDLDPDSASYLEMETIREGGASLPRIYDFAFHPTTGYAYAVDSKGRLQMMDPANGDFVELGDTGQGGTFGAAYFDAEGNFYVGRNKDGRIFRIRVDSGDYTAEPFATGPASSSNDGARCAAASVLAQAATADYGDAPDSYATSFERNGPRHGRVANPELFLGRRVDAESDAYPHPLFDGDESSESGERVSDDDAVQLVSQLSAGSEALALVDVSGRGVLSAWIDLDRDGRFDPRDLVVADLAVREGRNPVRFTLPADLSPGKTWARLRLSTAHGLEPVGGAPDGEVEDVELMLLSGRTTVSTYPSESGWATVAFEDNWPFVGDYDMNDLVMYLRTVTHRDVGLTTKVVIEGELAAVGASYHSGFGIALPGVRRDEVDEAGIEFTINGEPVVDRSALESGRTQAILIVDEDMRRYGAAGEDCDYFRTEPGCGADIPMTFSLSVPFLDGVDVPLSELLDPFLFATPGKWHGEHFAQPPGRSYEIHLKNRAPTEAFNPALFAGIGHDASDPDRGLYFQTENGLPWALAVGDRWEYPSEFRDVSDAYPSFIEFSLSSGVDAPFWYDPAAADDQHIFSE